MRLPARPAALFAFALLADPGAAQDLVIPKVTYPALPARAASAQGFVPPGWKLELQVSGDLNRDGRPDIAFVLRQQDPKNVIPNKQGLGVDPLDTNPRILAVVFANASSGYELAVQNHALIPRHIDPVLADPLDEPGGFTIERGALRVKLHLFSSAGSWTMSNTSYVFRHQNGRFELIGFDRETTQRNSGRISGISINYSTGKANITTGSIESDAKKVTSKSLRPGQLLTIDQIGDGLEFEPKP